MRSTSFRLNLFLIFYVLYELAGNMSTDMYLPSLLQIGVDFSEPFDAVQSTMTAWLFGLSCSQLFLGPCIDRWGARAVLLTGGWTFLLATLGCAIAPHLLWLILGRLFQGIAVGSIMIAGYATIHEIFDAHRATLILVWTSSACIASPMIGPFTGGVILLVGSWRWIFATILAFAFFPLLGLLFYMPKQEMKKKPKSFTLKAVISRYFRILSTRGFFTSTLTFGLIDSGKIFWLMASPYIIMYRYNYAPQEFGFLQMVVFFGFILGAQTVRFLLKIFSRTQVVYLGISCSILGALSFFYFACKESSNILNISISMSIYLLGYGICAAPLNKEAFLSTEESTGTVSSMFFFFISLLATLSSFFIALLPDSPPILGGLLCFSVVAAFLSFCFRKKRAIFG